MFERSSSNFIERPSYTPLAGISQNALMTSAFLSPVAIYWASIASFRLKTKFERYKLSTKTTGKAPTRASEHLERDLGWKPVALAALVVGVPTTTFCFSWFYLNGFLPGLLTLNIFLVAICDALGPALCQLFTKQVITSTRHGENARLRLKTTVFHERREILMLTVATALASFIVYSQSSNIWNAIVVFAIYFYISDDMSRNRMFRGGESVRGLVQTSLLNFLAFGVVAALGSLTKVVDVKQWYGGWILKWVGDTLDTQSPVGQPEITAGRLTASTGCLIAALYRFEARQLEYNLVSGTFVRKDDLKNVRTTVVGHHSPSKPAETLPPNDEVSAGIRRFIAPRRAASTSYEPAPPFSILTTPIATISLITFVFTHIPALVLSSAHPLYGLNHIVLAAADIGSLGSPSMEAFVNLFANIPPPFLALVTVPSSVTLLCWATWGKGGREVWGYAERWNVLEKDENPEEEDQEQALHLD